MLSLKEQNINLSNFISWLSFKKKCSPAHMENKLNYKKIKTDHISVTMGPTFNNFLVLYI
jgi:hypothetical protein